MGNHGQMARRPAATTARGRGRRAKEANQDEEDFEQDLEDEDLILDNILQQRGDDSNDSDYEFRPPARARPRSTAARTNGPALQHHAATTRVPIQNTPWPGEVTVPHLELPTCC